MRQLTHQSKPREESLQERLRNSLTSKLGGPVAFSGESCLLCDTSGSMAHYIGANTSKIDELRKLAADFKDIRRFQFSSNVFELTKEQEIGDAQGGTNMSHAFSFLKAAGLKHVVLITDGMPDNPTTALKEAVGLRIDIFYVGTDPAPEFLRLLAQQTGGSYGKASLEMRQALTAQVRKLIEGPKGGGIVL